MQSYKTVDGDRIDLIVLKHYGSYDMLATVLAHNTHLSSIPMSLTHGIEILLPNVEELLPYDDEALEKQQYSGWLDL